MKKLICILLIISTFALMLCSCGDNESILSLSELETALKKSESGLELKEEDASDGYNYTFSDQNSWNLTEYTIETTKSKKVKSVLINYTDKYSVLSSTIMSQYNLKEFLTTDPYSVAVSELDILSFVYQASNLISAIEKSEGLESKRSDSEWLLCAVNLFSKQETMSIGKWNIAVSYKITDYSKAEATIVAKYDKELKPKTIIFGNETDGGTTVAYKSFS